MKKLLIGLLVLSLVLWSVGTALAATFADTKGTKYERATGLLNSLGLLIGFPDGTFKPGDTITRAQFCAVAVRALGLASAAQHAAGATIFPDVPPTYWAVGFINAAVDRGVCNGFPGGTFRPDAPVTYAEALAMLVRVLGYEPSVTGSWPTNYLPKAFELGISEGVTFSPGAQAARGDAALLILNCLDIHLMEQVVVGGEVQHAVGEDTLLDGLGYSRITGWVEETGNVLFTDLRPDEAIVNGETFGLGGGVDLRPLLGLEVEAWLDDETIILASQLTDEGDVCFGRIAAVGGGSVAITHEEGAEEHQLSDEAIVYWNFVHKDASDVSPDWIGSDVMVVLDEDDVIVTLLAMQYEGSAVVTGIDYDKEEAWLLMGDAGVDRVEVGDYDTVLIVKDGAEIGLEGVQLCDVAHHVEFDGVLLLDMVREKVSGVLQETGADEDGHILLTVDGEEYVVDEDATCSSDNNGSFEAIDDETVETLAGEDVTVYLDKHGEARHVVAGLDEEAIDPARFVSQIDNRFFPLQPGTTFCYEGATDGAPTSDEVHVTHETKPILGVNCTVVRDRAFEDGVLVEETFDWYAQDVDGNVWYFGEDAKELGPHGNVISTEGSWEAGVSGASPGVIMEAEPQVGDRYHQEFSPGVAEDMAQVLSLDESASVRYGHFDALLLTKEWTPLERGVVEHKYFAEGVGFVLGVMIQGGDERSELVRIATEGQ